MVQVLVMVSLLPGPGGQSVGIPAPLAASVVEEDDIQTGIRGERSRFSPRCTNSLYLYLCIICFFYCISLFLCTCHIFHI